MERLIIGVKHGAINMRCMEKGIVHGKKLLSHVQMNAGRLMKRIPKVRKGEIMYSPADISNYEKKIIGAVKLDNRLHDEYKLTVDMFNNSIHREIYQVITSIIETGTEANDVTILDQLRKSKSKIDASVLMSFDVMSIANIKFYIDSLKEFNVGKRLHKLSLSIADKISAKEYGECIELIEQEIQNINAGNGTGEVYHIRDLLYEVIAGIEEKYKNGGGGIQGIKTGYPQIDKVLGGLENQKLIVIGARPSIGKTAFALNMTKNIAYSGIPCGFFSAETSRKSLIERLVSIDSKINSYAIRGGNLKKADFTNLITSFERFNSCDIFIDDTPNIKLKDLKTNALVMKRKGVKIIFIDYLTLINQGDNKIPKFERVGIIVKSIKQMCRELDMPIVLLSQVRRESEGKIPTLADLRQSGEIEEDADIICFLHGDRNKNEREFIIAKNKDGGLGTLKLNFIRSCLRFEESED